MGFLALSLVFFFFLSSHCPHITAQLGQVPSVFYQVSIPLAMLFLLSTINSLLHHSQKQSYLFLSFFFLLSFFSKISNSCILTHLCWPNLQSINFEQQVLSSFFFVINQFQNSLVISDVQDDHQNFYLICVIIVFKH